MQTTMKRLPIAILALAFLLAGLALPASAADSGPNFVVEPVYPDNQREQNGYFDLRVQPGQQQDLTVLVSNSGGQDIVVEVEAVNASTSPDGFIDYATPGIRDETLLYPFAELATIETSTVPVAAGGQAAITVSVQVPDAPFDGMVLGGIRILKLDERDAPDEMIVNAYQYALAVMLTENDDPVLPDLELVDVVAGLEDYRATVTAEIRNTQPVAAPGMQVQASLYQAGAAEPFYTVEDNLNIAPNSVWRCRFMDQEGYGYGSGDYRMYMRIEYGEQLWEFDRDFHISSREAAAINSGAVNQQAPQAVRQGGASFWIILLCMIGGLLLILLSVVLFLLRRKRNNS